MRSLCPVWAAIEFIAEAGGMKTYRFQLLLRLALAMAAGALWLSTPACLDWIEGLTGWNLDHRDGALETLVSGAFLVTSAILLVSTVMGARSRPSTSPHS